MFQGHSGSRWGQNTSCTATLSKVEGCLRNSLTCESPGTKWPRVKKQTFGGTMRRDVANADLGHMGVQAPTPSVTRGYPDVRREQESTRNRGNRFAGGGLSIVRSTKVASGVTGKKPANQRNAKIVIRLKNGLFIKSNTKLLTDPLLFWNETVKRNIALTIKFFVIRCNFWCW